MRNFRVFLVILLSGFLSVFYTNCSEGGDTSALFNGSGGEDIDNCFFEEDCEDDFVTNGDSSYLELEILNPDPTYVSVGQQLLPVSGGCNDGDFPKNRIDWRVMNVSGTVLFEGKIPNACVKNDFQLFLPLLNSYDQSIPHILELELVGLDDNNEEFTSELNTIKQIRLAPDPNNSVSSSSYGNGGGAFGGNSAFSSGGSGGSFGSGFGGGTGGFQ